MIKLFMLLFFILTSLNSQAETGMASTSGINPEQELLKVLLIMGVFIVLVIMSAFVLKRLMMQLGIKTDQLKVIASIPLGAKEKIVLIQVGEKQYLVGATSYSIRTLCEVDEKITDLDNKKITKKMNFNSILKRVS